MDERELNNIKKSIDPETDLLESEVKTLSVIQDQINNKVSRIEKHDFEKQGYIVHNNQIVTLRLQQMGLHSLPSGIGNFSSLQTLHLENNEFKYIDLRFLKNCPELILLDLSNNSLETIDFTPLKHCKKLSILLLDQNQICEIDLKPLQSCLDLDILSLKQNQIHDINISYLRNSNNLASLGLSDNFIKSLDISPLLTVKKFRKLWVDEGVTLYADPIHRDYSIDFHWFTSEYLPHVRWHIPENDPPSQTLYRMYEKIVKNFRIEEFWADYRDRRMLVPSAQSYEVRFFESAVEWYLSIKNRVRTDSSRELRNNKRQAIEYQHQDQFLGSPALITVLKDYFEFGYESEFTVQLFEGAIMIVRFWAYEGPSCSSLVQSISWIKIVVDDTHQSYQVTTGFNRGFLRFGKKYHPIPPPVDFPSDLHTSTEVMYEIDTFTTASLPDLLNRSRSWLKNFFFPKFDPDNPDVLYEM